MQTGCEKLWLYEERGRRDDVQLEKRLAEYRFGEASDDEVKFQAEVREMDINSCFPGSYLKAADLGGRTVKVLIDRVQEEDIGGENKPVMYFVGKDKGLVLNKTNSGVIVAVYGSETDEWSGKGLVLFPTKVSFQGSMVDAIRLRCDVPEAAPDEIPF